MSPTNRAMVVATQPVTGGLRAAVAARDGRKRFDDFTKEMLMRCERAVAAIAGLALVSAAPGALAHSFGAAGAGFGAGFGHPFLGLDHLAAMVAVGIWRRRPDGAGYGLCRSVFMAVITFAAVLGLYR